MDTKNTVDMKLGVRKRLTYLFSYGAHVDDVRQVLRLMQDEDAALRPRVETARFEALPAVLARLEAGEVRARVALLYD